MNMQPVGQTRSSANGFVGGRVERDTGSRQENKLQPGKSSISRPTSAGSASGGSSRGFQSPSRDRLVYLTTCLIGHHVDVQVKNGSIYSGIFHATNAEKDFGIVLKMARQTKNASRNQKGSAENFSKPPSKTLIIPGNELVQVIAKDVSITANGLSSDIHHEKVHEIMIDSSIAQSRNVEVERKLERWVPDEDDSECPELDNIFDGTWNRSWDQFQVNESLFGVKSTFDEEIYTTKLERGPQMREKEREASRIAREIEGEDTQDLHLAEERGKLHDDYNFDEEARFSSVLRVDDRGYEESEDIMLDSRNMETFESSTNAIYSRPFSNLTTEKSNDGNRVYSASSSTDELQPFQSTARRDVYGSGSNDQGRHLTASFTGFGGQNRLENQFVELKGGSNYAKESLEREHSVEEAQKAKSIDSNSSLGMKEDGADKVALSPDAMAYDPSSHVPKDQDKTITPSDQTDVTDSHKSQDKTHLSNSRGRPGSSIPSTSGGASDSVGHGLSPSSSLGSLSSERSTLNPHAKEFKFNPNAKSFVPCQAPARPVSPVPEGSFYYPGVSAVPHIPGMPVGIGVGPSYAGHQPVMFNPQAATMQSPQPYFHPNGPQYGQQMMLGHPRQVMYMTGYPPGRDY